MRAFFLLLGLALVLATPPAAADETRLARFNHAIWTAKDGAPGAILSMAQTDDGWLWLGTSAGLYRFDGLTFERYVAPDGAKLLGDSISMVRAQPGGDLWIGYYTGGLSVLHQGRLRHLSLPGGAGPAGGPANATYNAVIDGDGSAWVAAASGLLHFAGGTWRAVGAEAGFTGDHADDVLLDQYGRLWASNGEALFRFERSSGTFRRVAATGGRAGSLVESPDGRLWLDNNKTLTVVAAAPAGGPAPQARAPGLNGAVSQDSGLFDRDGNHWALLCPTGVCLTAGAGGAGKTALAPARESRDRLDQPWQMGSLAANAILEDREGDIWIGTMVGLERFRRNRIAATAIPGSDRFFSLARDTEGGVWAAGSPSDSLWSLSADGPAVRRRTAALVANGRDGALLLAGERGIERRYRGRRSMLPALPPAGDGKPARVVRLADDGLGLWAGISYSGTLRLVDGKWIAAEQYGLPKGLFLATPAGPGQLWMGYRDGSVIFFDGKPPRTSRLTRYAGAAAPQVGPVTVLYRNPEATDGEGVVAGGESGMAVLRGGRFRRLQATDPAVLESVSGIAATADGDRWLNGRMGLVHVRSQDWRRAMTAPADQGAPLNYELADGLDGYPGAALTRLRLPTALADGQGRLWFAGSGGIAWLDPRALSRNTLSPPVEIEALAANGRSYAPDGVLAGAAPSRATALPAGSTAVRIDYTALSYVKPERVRFRYRLDGVDAGWQEAGTRRAAYYSNLGPGDYRFSVIASNDDGPWSATGAAMRFSIAPTLRQTWWFHALCGLAIVLLLWGLYRLRMDQLAAQIRARLRERTDERERIARELHDTLLQSIHGLVLNVHAAMQSLPPGTQARAKIETALVLADAVIVQGRDRVYGLRGGDVGNDADADTGGAPCLINALRDAAAEGAGRAAATPAARERPPALPSFEMTAEGAPRRLQAIAVDELRAIGREALLNAYAHAGASAIVVRIRYLPDELLLTIADDGCGIPDAILEAGGRAGHWGLAGMRERSARIKAKLALRRLPEGGTECLVAVPAATAYAQPARCGAVK
jgi:ligand-binding sensor domain-containing protein